MFKKYLIFIILVISCSIPLFAQSYFLWSTGTNQQGSNIKLISVNAAKADILNIFDQNHYIYYSWDSENHYTTRANYKRRMLEYYNNYKELNNQQQVIYFSWVNYWLDNNRNFAFAHSSEVPDLRSGKMVWHRTTLVCIVVGEEVITISFSKVDPYGNGFPTNANNRDVIVGIMNDYLK